MTRLVGGLTEIKRTARDVAVTGPANRTTGIGERVAWSPRSEVGGAGTVGAGEPPSLSQSHGPDDPAARFAFGVSGRGSSDGAGASQQQPAVLAARFAAQQGRLQHGVGAATDVTAGSFGVSGAGAGVRGGGRQTQARAGATVPITVETASKRQTNDRTRHKVGIKTSYTWPLIAVNSIPLPNERKRRSGVQGHQA